MAKLSKRVRAFKEKVQPGKAYAFDDA
ncbi:MAG TPA: 50S ribosomal protein L1, partial [Halieaceae bacterium]|nr:50S ribosomal protein L1 [Halieaceae bacterium]